MLIDWSKVSTGVVLTSAAAVIAFLFAFTTSRASDDDVKALEELHRKDDARAQQDARELKAAVNGVIVRQHRVLTVLDRIDKNTGGPGLRDTDLGDPVLVE